MSNTSTLSLNKFVQRGQELLRNASTIKSPTELFYRIYWRYQPTIHWNRVVMDESTEKMIRKLPYQDFSVLEISGSKWKDFGFKSYETLKYPDFDICEEGLNLGGKQYDLIIAEQVFEHLLWPYRAGKNVFNLLKLGGFFLNTLPFLIVIHNCPVDCSRWTELGLKYFLAECGFPLENTVTDAWGNRSFLKAHAKRGVVPFYIKHIHSLKNESKYPASIWSLSQKPV